MFRFTTIALLAAMTLSVGCESAYYNTWEKLGWHKRDLLADSVEDARDDQQAAKEQFADALEQFSAIVGFEGGELESKYRKLADELDASEAAAERVRDQIAEVQSVADALFEEWEEELDEYTDAELRRASARQLRTTQDRYGELITLMQRAESKMEPVLKVFRDQVLFLKHNLNARAVASLQGVAAQLEQDVATLLRDMEASIREANEFLKQMEE